MRIRSIKPEWIEDERLLKSGSDARVLSVALLLLSDDYGRGRANQHVLAGQVFALEDNPLATLQESLAKLRGWFVRLYEVRGQSYFEVTNWSKHQRVDKPGKPRVPEPEGPEIPDTSESSGDARETPGNGSESLAPDHDQERRTRTRSESVREAPLVSRLAGCWDGLGGINVAPTTKSKLRASEQIICRLAGDRDPVEWFQILVDRFKADDRVRKKRLGFDILLGQLDQWADEGPIDHSKATSHAQHELDASDTTPGFEDIA